MIVQAIKTPTITPRACTLFELLDEHIKDLAEQSVVAITSKIVSLCEGATVPLESTTKEELIKAEADYYVPLPANEYGIVFTVINNTLLPNAGVDESNAAGVYVLWPHDAQATANAVREYLCKRFGLQDVGVIITDSTARPLRWGMGGIAIAHSGFKEIHDYRGEHDLFDRPFAMETSSISGGLAAAAVLVMGEGAESTPLATIQDVAFVEFQARNPSAEELEALHITVQNDLYAPILKGVSWVQGSGKSAVKTAPDSDDASRS
jgi:F420-0:gamma-glutamyl ligase